MPNQLFSYSVKFVCGTQPEPGPKVPHACTPVRPGTYATEINIYNYNRQTAEIKKLFVPVVLSGEPIGREPRVAKVHGEDKISLPQHTATMDDCCRIDEVLKLPAGLLTIGFLEIISTVELSVTAVYTATDLKSNSLSIDVDQIQPKLVSLG